MSEVTPIRPGVLLAGLAAALFGVTAPLLQAASRGAGAFASGALLYLGAGVAALAGARRPATAEAPLRWADAPSLASMALAGAVLAPAALVLGLRGTDAASAALLLGLEAPCTVALAWAFLGERIGRRVVAACALLVAGAAVLGAGRAPGAASLSGGALVAAATLLWGVDNTLSRHLADRSPTAVVGAKGLVGGAAAALVAAAVGDPWPAPAPAAALFALGAVGYGLSLRAYLGAQRVIGAARTASVFASAPFVGAAAALAVGAAAPDRWLAAAAGLMAAGVWLHATERHAHRHAHAALEHEHAHVHTDGHHGHAHVAGLAAAEPHSHVHAHEAFEHEHEHGEDLHHLHRH